MSSRRDRNIGPDAQPDSSGNTGNYSNPNGQQNMNNLGQLFNNLDLGQVMGQLSQMMGGSPGGGFPGNPQGVPRAPQAPRDARIQLLQSMKPFLNRRRGTMIDSIGQLYAIARIIRGGKK